MSFAGDRGTRLAVPGARCANGARQPTSHQEPSQLFVRYHASRSPADLELLVGRYASLARYLAGRYAGGGEPFDDLFQVACLGLLKAIDRYDPARGSAFTSFAVPTIVGELKRHFRDKTWAVHVPHRVHDLAMRVRRTTPELTLQLGRRPSPHELASALMTGEDEIRAAIDALAAYEVDSLEAQRDDERSSPLAEALGSEDDGFRQIEHGVDMDGLLARLSPVERRVLRLRFEDDLTQQEIGDRLGISQMGVSRMLRRLLAQLHSVVDEPAALAG